MLSTRRLPRLLFNKTKKNPLSNNKFKEDFDKALISAKHIVDPYYKKYPEEAILLEKYIKQHLNPDILQKVKDAYVGKRQTFSGGNSILSMFLVICTALFFLLILLISLQQEIKNNVSINNNGIDDVQHISELFPSVKDYVQKDLFEVVPLFNILTVLQFSIKIPEKDKYNLNIQLLHEELISKWVSPVMQSKIESLSLVDIKEFDSKAYTLSHYFEEVNKYNLPQQTITLIDELMHPEFTQLVSGVWSVCFLPTPVKNYDPVIKTVSNATHYIREIEVPPIFTTQSTPAERSYLSKIQTYRFTRILLERISNRASIDMTQHAIIFNMLIILLALLTNNVYKIIEGQRQRAERQLVVQEAQEEREEILRQAQVNPALAAQITQAMDVHDACKKDNFDKINEDLQNLIARLPGYREKPRISKIIDGSIDYLGSIRVLFTSVNNYVKANCFDSPSKYNEWFNKTYTFPFPVLTPYTDDDIYPSEQELANEVKASQDLAKASEDLDTAIKEKAETSIIEQLTKVQKDAMQHHTSCEIIIKQKKINLANKKQEIDDLAAMKRFVHEHEIVFASINTKLKVVLEHLPRMYFNFGASQGQKREVVFTKNANLVTQFILNITKLFEDELSIKEINSQILVFFENIVNDSFGAYQIQINSTPEEIKQYAARGIFTCYPGLSERICNQLTTSIYGIVEYRIEEREKETPSAKDSPIKIFYDIVAKSTILSKVLTSDILTEYFNEWKISNSPIISEIKKLILEDENFSIEDNMLDMLCTELEMFLIAKSTTDFYHMYPPGKEALDKIKDYIYHTQNGLKPYFKSSISEVFSGGKKRNRISKKRNRRSKKRTRKNKKRKY
jgi:hypothetical protein